LKFKAYVVSMRFHWGYSIRTYFASKFTDSYLIPPMNTIIGAIAMAKNARCGNHVENSFDKNDLQYSKAKDFSNKLKYYAINFDKIPIKFSTLIRTSTTIYWLQQVDIPKTPQTNLFAPIHFGIVSYLNGRWNLFMVGDLDKIDLYSMTRLGSKESILTILKVEEIVDYMKLEKGQEVYDIAFSFPGNMAKRILGSFIVEKLPKFSEHFYDFKIHKNKTVETEIIYIPNPTLKVTLAEPALVFNTPYGKVLSPIIW